MLPRPSVTGTCLEPLLERGSFRSDPVLIGAAGFKDEDDGKVRVDGEVFCCNLSSQLLLELNIGPEVLAVV